MPSTEHSTQHAKVFSNWTRGSNKLEMNEPITTERTWILGPITPPSEQDARSTGTTMGFLNLLFRRRSDSVVLRSL